MQRRRARILSEARRLITGRGYEALNTRALAKAAEVSAPTLYNLIGSKDEILQALELEAIEQIEARLSKVAGDEPLAMAEAIVHESAALFAEDESYYRAAVVAGERRAGGASHAEGGLVGQRAVDMAAKACRAATAAGLLRGNVGVGVLSQQMYQCYLTPFRDWGYGEIDLAEFKRRVLRGFYLLLAADAVEEFRSVLLAKLK